MSAAGLTFVAPTRDYCGRFIRICNSPARLEHLHLNDLAMQTEKSAQSRALQNLHDHIWAFDQALNAVTANSSLK
jgi:hypothetical protein